MHVVRYDVGTVKLWPFIMHPRYHSFTCTCVLKFDQSSWNCCEASLQFQRERKELRRENGETERLSFE